MKITTETTPVQTGGNVGEARQFTISATREAFDILSSKLYNDKIGAVIRELSTNAYDSHVAAGKKETPFEIHLPTRWEPYFEVKDFGPGLSDDQIHSLYTNYFSSSRSQSNDFVGALGLGSKSPFSYTKIFSVISRHQGKTRIYSALLDDGLPVIRQMGEETDSTEPDGVAVKLAVEEKDISEFQGKAAHIYEFFDPYPKFNIKITVKKTDYIIKSEKWGLRRSEYWEKPRAIQGMVPYSIGVVDESRLDDKQHQLLSIPLDLFFGIGELSVAASREHLSNDEFTITNIIKALEHIRWSLIEDTKKQIDACKVQWEARLLINNLTNAPGLGPLVYAASQAGEFIGKYKNFSLGKAVDPVLGQSFCPNLLVSTFRKSPRTAYATKTRLSDGSSTTKLAFTVDPTVGFCVNDIGFGAGKYVNYFLQESDDSENIKKLYFFDKKDSLVPLKTVVQEAFKVVQELGNPDLIFTSDLQKKYRNEVDKPKASSGATQYVKKDVQELREDRVVTCNEFGNYREKKWREVWLEPSQFPLPTGKKFYVQLKRGGPITGNFECAEDLQKFALNVKKAEFCDFKDTVKLYGIAPELALPKHPDWVEFYGYVKNEFNKYLTKQVEEELSFRYNHYSEGKENLMEYIVDNNLLHDKSPMKEFSGRFVKAWSSYLANQDKVKALSTLVSHFGKQISNIVDFNVEAVKVFTQYPMLVMIGLYTPNNAQLQNIVDYIQMVDERNNRGTS